MRTASSGRERLLASATSGRAGKEANVPVLSRFQIFPPASLTIRELSPVGPLRGPVLWGSADREVRALHAELHPGTRWSDPDSQ